MIVIILIILKGHGEGPSLCSKICDILNITHTSLFCMYNIVIDVYTVFISLNYCFIKSEAYKVKFMNININNVKVTKHNETQYTVSTHPVTNISIITTI